MNDNMSTHITGKTEKEQKEMKQASTHRLEREQKKTVEKIDIEKEKKREITARRKRWREGEYEEDDGQRRG
jgi:hypothetical protein